MRLWMALSESPLHHPISDSADWLFARCPQAAFFSSQPLISARVKVLKKQKDPKPQAMGLRSP
jgi:hypothetical protein